MKQAPAAATVLIVAPHPDDEAIGAWALIRRLRRSRARVDILVVSDGGASHPGSRRWPRGRLVAERRRETRRAMRSIGVTPDHIRFLGLPDGALDRDPAALRRTLAKALRRSPPARLIVGPVVDDAHADHRAVALALRAVRAPGSIRLGYHVWPMDRRRRRGLCVPLDMPAMRIKRRIVRGYRTQAGLVTDAIAGFAMTHRHLRGFIRPLERFERLA